MIPGTRVHRRTGMLGRRKSAGLTLIEVLVAFAIGGVVIAGILSLFISSLESATFQNAASRVQESGRFATDHIARTMRMARYDDPTTSATSGVADLLKGTTSADGGLSMTGFTLKSGTDVVQITHEGAPQVRDCQGVAVAADVWVTNTYAISNNDELICRTTTNNPTVIAEGVEDMVIMYGVDTDATPDGIANRYVNQGGVTDWNTVVSARVILLINSVDGVFASSIHGCESCNVFNPASSSLLHAEFLTTVRFRNL